MEEGNLSIDCWLDSTEGLKMELLTLSIECW